MPAPNPHGLFMQGIYTKFFNEGREAGALALWEKWQEETKGNSTLGRDYDKYFSALQKDIKEIEKLFNAYNNPTVVEEIEKLQKEMAQLTDKQVKEKKAINASIKAQEKLLDYTFSKFNRAYENSNLSLSLINDKQGDATIYQKFINENQSLFNRFSENYHQLHQNMIQGYQAEIKIGQSVRTNFQNFGYFFPIIGTTKEHGDVLKNAYTLTESGMQKLLNMENTTRINLIRSKSGDYTAALSLNRKFEGIQYSQEFFSKMSEDDVINGLRFYDKNNVRQFRSVEKLSDDFNLVKKAYSDGKILRTDLSPHSKLKSNRLTEIIADQNGAMDTVRQIMRDGTTKNGYYMFDLENISFVAGSDVMDRGHELSVKTLGQNNIQLASGKSIKNFYDVFSSKDSVLKYVEQSFDIKNYKPRMDQSKHVTERIVHARQKINGMISDLSEVKTNYNKIQKSLTTLFNQKDPDLDGLIKNINTKIHEGKNLTKEQNAKALADYLCWIQGLETDLLDGEEPGEAEGEAMAEGEDDY